MLGENLKKELFNVKKNGWEEVNEEEKKAMFEYCEKYINFLNASKTERETIENAKKMAIEKGFKDIAEMESLKYGDKIYYINKEKAMFLAVIGKENMESGINIIGAHVDSPRLDLKPNPLYEDDGFSYLKTHYYGGIKKYQWTAIPLSIRGIIIKSNGEKVKVNIGEDKNDPIFTITDLLPHLAKNQMTKKLGEAIEGEDLNILIGSIPFVEENSNLTEKIKLNILKILNEKYGIVEADFISAELEIVPAFEAKSLGFDKSMIAGYGQDDRVCSYVALDAILKLENIAKTSVCILADKEEIGSVGNTGMQSQVFDRFMGDILTKLGINRTNLLETVYCNSKMLSADVDGGYDPIYKSVEEKNNSAFLGRGVGVNKYTGSRGKYEASDANAEYVAFIRKIFEENDIKYQFSELGKIDEGGGGTIAYILANKGIDVIDCGVPVLSMHSPYEVTSKFDIYMAYKAYSAFLNS